MRVAGAAALIAAGAVAVAPAPPAGAEVPPPTVLMLARAGADQTYLVPPGVTQLNVQIMGAGGGRGGHCHGLGTAKGGEGDLGAFILAQMANGVSSAGASMTGMTSRGVPSSSTAVPAGALAVSRLVVV